MIIFNKSLTTIEKTDTGYQVKSPLYSFSTDTIPQILTLETVTEFIQESRHDRIEKISADFSDFSDTYLTPINEN